MDAVNPRDFYNNLLGTLPLHRSNGRTLSTPDVGLILGACLGLKRNNPTQGGSTLGGSLSSLSVKEDVAVAVIRFCTWDEEAGSVDADVLRDFLCVLCPYRTLQKRLQVRVSYAVISLLF